MGAERKEQWSRSLEGFCQTEEEGIESCTGGVETSGVQMHVVFRGREWTGEATVDLEQESPPLPSPRGHLDWGEPQKE